MKRVTLVCVALALAVLAPLAAAPARQAPAPNVSTRPRLVVVLVVDQMRADYVEKYGGQWKAGLARLLREGAWFREAAYPYVDTVTCAGHTTISTGSFPSTHGMVGNAWLNRADGKMVGCVEDASAPLVGYQRPVQAGAGPSRLVVPTFSDELRVQTSPTPRVVTLSLKDRTAIVLAGHRGDAVTWFDIGQHTWTTSAFYGTAPVPFVKQYTDQHPVDSQLRLVWTRLLAPQNYAFPDDTEGEVPPAGWSTSFPHPLEVPGKTGADYARWEESPFSDEYLEGLAEAAVDALHLGGRASTDFLAISFSALDLVGHAFGPRSEEVEDLLARLDLTVGKLLAHLDASVGAGRYVVALSADHGVAPVPEEMQRQGLPAGRASADAVVQAIDRALDGALGPHPHATRIFGNDVYLSPTDREGLGRDRGAIAQVAGAAEAQAGVARVLWTADLRNRVPNDDPLARAAAFGYFPDRSGDLLVIPKPYWFLLPGSPKQMATAIGTTHGSPYPYDQRVPVILMGPGIKAGDYLGAVTPADIAPTLALLCGITLAHPDGRPLIEAVAAKGPKG